MEKIKLIFLIVAAASFAVHFSCKEKKLCEGVPIFDSYFSFKLVDKYGINLIAAWGARYLSDSVYLTKMDGSLPNQLGISGGGRIGFVIPDDDSEAKDSMVTREFLLYLPDNQGHPKDDVDTLKFQYLFNQSCYEKFRVWYNDSLYHDGQYIDFILLIKN
jgi:hypothetical protein